MLSIDLETYSPVDLSTEGLYKYVSHPDFEILLFGYKYEGEDAIVIDLANGEDLPDRVFDSLFDEELKTAWNAAFEIACINKYFKTKLDISTWECTMIRASMLGYPLSLDAAGKALRLETTKDRAGKALIKLFTMPDKHGNKVERSGAKWDEFISYCKTDVVVETAIREKIKFLKINAFERRLWVLDQKINNVGILLDVQLAIQAVTLKEVNAERLMKEAIEVTGLENPNSIKQFKEWLEANGVTVTSLDKEAVKDLLKYPGLPDNVVKALLIKQRMGKSSLEKFQTMLDMCGEGNRIRGLFQLYGASKTGRWAGRGVQVQNLTHTKLPQLEIARELLKAGDADSLEMIYGDLSHAMSMLIRTAFVAPDGHDLTVSDFSAIEARVTAWFANEKWRLDVFKGHGKIYEASAAMMYKIDIEEVTKEMRSKGKIAELALGYQGSVGAMERMGSEKMGLKPEELKPIVDAWRKASPAIVALWRDVNNAAILAIENPGQAYRLKHLMFICKNGNLFIQLPSGRFLSYVGASTMINKFNLVGIRYWALDERNQWMPAETYGGKLVENIVQGTSRDVLAVKMVALDDAGWVIPLHVHDEVAVESKIDQDVSEVTRIMEEPIDWAPGLPLKAATFRTPFYIKD